MKKPIILIVNGRPGAGKDTFAKILGEKAKVKKISIIDLTKELATLAGWDGFKNDISRRFLSDLKGLIDDFNDASFIDIMGKVILYVNSGEYDYILIDARRMQDIDRMKREFNAFSLYIHNENITHIPINKDDLGAIFGGEGYDFNIANNTTIDKFENVIEVMHKHWQQL